LLLLLLLLLLLAHSITHIPFNFELSQVGSLEEGQLLEKPDGKKKQINVVFIIAEKLKASYPPCRFCLNSSSIPSSLLN
jgi:hypothetical protein